MAFRVFILIFIAGVYSAVPAKAYEQKACSGNYVPEGLRGHGSITFTKGTPVGWTVVDYRDSNNENCTLVVCRYGVIPDPQSEDLDFFEVNGEMHKLISGNVVVRPEGFTVTPRRARRLRFFSTPSAFPAAKTPSLYQVNLWRKNKMANHASMSPSEYLRHLKAQNETCVRLPIEE
ncbi:hypothetical protein PUV54_10645 [Hyphococcus flavus]|uniref:Uncharacterized protein n=1 Tax=Hyphococcus flavus TaxID=1866326 RepID=A0AAF0CDX6_9PROT|nr:hypothetical protein [Hyphococcus flavus]WDI30416.1 hypothetical protein PUV54_10645 [Hyphococcus flavus]